MFVLREFLNQYLIGRIIVAECSEHHPPVNVRFVLPRANITCPGVRTTSSPETSLYNCESVFIVVNLW